MPVDEEIRKMLNEMMWEVETSFVDREREREKGDSFTAFESPKEQMSRMEIL